MRERERAFRRGLSDREARIEGKEVGKVLPERRFFFSLSKVLLEREREYPLMFWRLIEREDGAGN